LSEWDDDDGDDNNSCNDNDNCKLVLSSLSSLSSSSKQQQQQQQQRPVIVVDDTTEQEHQRRIEIAKIHHGLIYNEQCGIQTILESLTPHEHSLLSDEYMPLRHYRAEKGNINEAIRKLKCTIQWRTTFGVEDIKHCFDTTTATNTTNEKQEYDRKHLAQLITRESETGKILQIPNQLFFSALKTRFSASV
jgi:hypothetical protein